MANKARTGGIYAWRRWKHQETASCIRSTSMFRHDDGGKTMVLIFCSAPTQNTDRYIYDDLIVHVDVLIQRSLL